MLSIPVDIFNQLKMGIIICDSNMLPLYINNFVEKELNLPKDKYYIQNLLRSYCVRNKKIMNYEVTYLEKKLSVQSIQFISENDTKWFHFLKFNSNNNVLEKILKYSFDEIFITDPQGKILMVSDSSERLYGLKPKEMVGAQVNEIDAFWPKLTYRVLEKKSKVTSIQHTITGKNLIVTSSPIYDYHGNIIQVISNTRDLNEILLKDNMKSGTERNSTSLSLNRKNYFFIEHDDLAYKEHDDLAYKLSGMKEVYTAAKRVAPFDSNILILGESGVGKNVLANFIHSSSNRKFGPFIEINCGAIPESLLESELFGYEEGAFTGSRKGGKLGLVELANGGTLFLNEIADLPLFLQVKFLRVLESHKINPLGSNIEKRVDFRLIAATNRDIHTLVAQNKFREDLYYRLNVVPIIIPPLRDRPRDIIDIAKYYLKIISDKYGIKKELSIKAYEILKSYHWPGNVRELENVIERALLTTPAKLVTDEHIINIIPFEDNHFRNLNVNSTTKKMEEPSKIANIIAETEKKVYRNALTKYGTTRKIAKILGVSQATVARKIKHYSLNK